RMKACLVVSVAMMGCGFPRPPDVNPDAPSAGDAPAAPVCFGKIVPICFPASAVPSAPRTLLTVENDTDLTDTGSLCDQNNDQKAAYCVVAGAGVSLPAGKTVTAHGSKPLILLSTAAMELLGSIDVSSHLTGGPQPRGAGANPTDLTACVFATRAVAATMGGGGAGASFGQQGGGGGNPAGSATGGGIAGSRLDMFPAGLRGGCRGNDGSATAGSPAAGGDGGGAVALIAAMQIQVDASINASGGGGKGGAAGAANGGGGGSGGMIAFDSPQPLVFGANARLWANGGSGGQGGSVTTGGAPGAESDRPNNPGSPVNVSGAGGVGADGAIGDDLGGHGGNALGGGGGGGGGGGVGFIHAPGLTNTASISPSSSG
ncbi:MAG TPA: hypothetical protein VF516_01230, partial [Kofleriaceae bacterium]